MIRNLELDADPVIVLSEADDEIIGDLHFPLTRFSMATMEEFGRNFLVFIRALLRHPDGRVKDVLLV